MRILEVISTLGSGGAERLCVDLCNTLCKTEEVGLMVIKDVNRPGLGFYLNELDPKVKLIVLGFGDGFGLPYIFKTRSSIKAFNPDVVHIHAVENYCIAAILTYRKPKYFVTIHNSLNLYGSVFHKFLFRVLCPKGAFRPVTISDVNYADFSRAYPECRFELVYNGRASLKRTEEYENVLDEVSGYRKTEKTKIFVSVGRCAQQKNQGLLVSAFNRMVSEGSDVSLLVIGSGFDSEDGKALKEQACDDIHFIGEVKNVSDYLYSSDIFCLSSMFEGMPISVIEAQLCGLPVVSTPVCGVIDVVESGVNGVISKDCSEDSFREALRQSCIQLETLRQNVQARLLNYPYGIDNCARSYLRLFKDEYSIESDLKMLQAYSPCPSGTSLSNNALASNPECDLQIIIPVYKVEKYLPACLDSVIKQKTRYKVKIIIVDDGSPDRCPKICDEYARKDPRIKVIHQGNKGISGARNAGLKHIDAKYVMFVDSDDKLIDGSIDKMMACADATGADIVAGTHRILRSGISMPGPKVPATGDVEYTVLSGYPWGKVYRSGLFQNVSFPEGFWFEDTLNLFVLFPLSKVSWQLPDAVYEYRVNRRGLSNMAANKPKCLDTFWVTGLLMAEREKLGLKADPLYLLSLSRQFDCNNTRLQNAPERIRKAVSRISENEYSRLSGN